MKTVGFLNHEICHCVKHIYNLNKKLRSHTKCSEGNLYEAMHLAHTASDTLHGEYSELS